MRLNIPSELGNDLARGLSKQVDGFIAIPEGRGIGVELVEDVENRFPYRKPPIEMRPHVDGSVIDMSGSADCRLSGIGRATRSQQNRRHQFARVQN